MNVRDLLTDIPHTVLTGTPPRDSLPMAVSGISSDSRKVKPGHLFVAVAGTKENGHRFVEDALSRGAVLVMINTNEEASLAAASLHIPIIAVSDTRDALSRLSARWFGFPSETMTVFGVTGTNGKSTTTQLISQLLTPLGRSGAVTTVDWRYDNRIFPSDMTTPDPWELQLKLRTMCEAGVRFGAVEVSSHALMQRRVHDVHFKRCVFTNLTQDHLDYHGDMESYFQAKRKLFFEVKNDAPAIINADDLFGARLIKELSPDVISYGLHKPGLTYAARDVTTAIDGSRFVFECPAFTEAVLLPLPGLHNVYNFLGAAAAAIEEGLSRELFQAAISGLKPVSGRLEPIDEGQPFRVFVDYAHTPDGVERVLSFLADTKKGKLHVVFGCGGDRDRGKRPLMGALAERFADRVTVTSDNPRSESPEQIIRDISASRVHRSGVIWQETPDRKQAIWDAVSEAKPEDVVAVLGKGHEQVQIIGNKREPFSDQDVIREALRKQTHVLS